jgi:catecholate siderophore receptor
MKTVINTRRLKALGASSLVLGTAAVLASQAMAQDTKLGTVKVQSEAIDPNPNAVPGVPYKAKTSGDERRTAPIAETPATIQVITAEQIKDSGATDLKSILIGQAGITTGTGENGNMFGDRYIIRGQEAKSDTFVDGLRDPGMSIRESFAVDQIEITKGPSSTFAGRGSAGGAINAITKLATTDYNFVKSDATGGSANYSRFTIDANQALSDTIAVRANLLYSYSQVPDRAPSDRYRAGAAVSATWNMTPDADLTVDYYGLHAKDGPDTGGYLVGTGAARKPRTPIPPSVTQDADFLRSDQNIGTVRFHYRFSPDLRFSNILRAGGTQNGYVLTSAERDATTTANNAGGSYLTSSVGTHQSWQNVDYFADQASLFYNATIAGLANEFVASYEYSDNHVLNGNYINVNTGPFNCITGTSTGTTNNAYCPTFANNVPRGFANTLGRVITKGNPKGEWEVKTSGLSLMDTVKLADNVTFFGGIRQDWFDYNLDVINTTTLVRTHYPYSGTLTNYHAGLVWQITPEINVYASFGTAQDINGGESDVGNNSSYGGLQLDPRCGCAPPSDPETSDNFEIGTKWNLFDDRLLATFAAFQTTKHDVNEALSASETEAFGTVNTGENRVSGIEFELVGNITDDLMVQGALTYASAEVLKSKTPANVGHTLANFANFSANIQAKYRITEAFSAGIIGQYVSKRYGGQPDTAAPFANGFYSQPAPAYAKVDLFATYKYDANLGFRLNVGNLFDRDYYTAVYRGGFFLYKGDARNVRLSLDYDL